MKTSGMEDCFWRNLVGEMESSKIIDEVNVYGSRPIKELAIVSPFITVHTLRKKGGIKTVSVLTRPLSSLVI